VKERGKQKKIWKRLMTFFLLTTFWLRNVLSKILDLPLDIEKQEAVYLLKKYHGITEYCGVELIVIWHNKSAQ